MMALFGVVLGAVGLRFWWHGLATLIALTIVLCVVGTAGALNDPIVQANGAHISGGSVAYALAIQFCVLLVGYAIGAGGRWLFNRRDSNRG